MRWLLPLALSAGVCVAGCAAEPQADANPAPTVMPVNAVVERVVDGDTLEVRVAGHHETVRLIGIDTPEVVDPHRPVQCFGAEASARAKTLIPPGTPLYLERDAEPRDRYGRLLVYARRAGDGLFVNLELAQGGYTDSLSIPPNTAHAADIGAAVARARAEQRGLWGACGGPGVPLPAAATDRSAPSAR